MISIIWYTYIYQPLFNALIWIYNNIADKNMGWAVVWLTIFLRVILLPLTIISEKNALKEEKAQEEAKEKAMAFKNDPIAQKDEIRRVMKKYKISPWAKVATLGIQLFVLILLYQVFVRGISGEKMLKYIYSSIDYPGKINKLFYGFDIGKAHDLVWSSVVTLYLFVSILLSNKNNKKWESSTAIFLFAFPLFTFAALWILPMVKSLFILTSMIFSDIISLLRKLFFPVKQAEVKK